MSKQNKLSITIYGASNCLGVNPVDRLYSGFQIDTVLYLNSQFLVLDEASVLLNGSSANLGTKPVPKQQ